MKHLKPFAARVLALALCAALALLGAGERAEVVLRALSLALAGGLALGGCVLFLKGAVNVTLPLTALWLLIAAPVEKNRLALDE